MTKDSSSSDAILLSINGTLKLSLTVSVTVSIVMPLIYIPCYNQGWQFAKKSADSGFRIL